MPLLLAAAMAALLAAVDATSNGSSGAVVTHVRVHDKARQVRWWMSFSNPENNLRLIDSHPKASTLWPAFPAFAAYPQCLRSDTVPIRSRTWTFRRSAILHRLIATVQHHTPRPTATATWDHPNS